MCMCVCLCMSAYAEKVSIEPDSPVAAKTGEMPQAPSPSCPPSNTHTRLQ